MLYICIMREGDPSWKKAVKEKLLLPDLAQVDESCTWRATAAK